MTKLKPPLISVRDSSDTQIGVLIDYFNDSIERFLEGKVSVLTLSALDENNNRELLNEGNFLSFTYNGEDYHLTIVKKDEDEDVITITAWSLVLELNNETKNPYTGSNMTFVQYLNAFDGERILTVNINEVSDKKISHTWDSQQTMLERLFSLATVFDAEIEFETILAEDGSLEKLQVNAYKAHSSTNQGIGKNRSAEVFYFGEDITTVKKSTDIMNLYTAIRPIGKDGLTLNGYKMDDVKGEDGETLFFLKNGTIYAPRARELYPSNLINKGDRWTVYDWDTEYDSQATLCGNALAKLRDELSTPAITWTIEGYIDANIGDTISVYDDGYKPTLLLEARINSQRISMTDPSSNETTFSNIKQVDSQVSDDLIARMNELIQANKTYDVQILTSDGYSFKNGVGETTLTARVMDGPKDASKDFVINWYRETDLIGPNASITVQASSIDEKVVYRIIAYKDGVERGRNELTLINVNDGVQGPQGEQGPAGQDGIPGKDGLGITNTSITYAQATSGTTAPSTGWAEQVPTLIKGQYLWTKTTWTYTDKSTETGYTVSYNAKDGNDGNDGVAGKDGVGIANTTVQYAQSTSGTTKPTSGWSTTIPIVASGNYLWTKTTWTYTDGTSESGYSVAKMGERGPQGLQGIQGPKGDQGIAGPTGADGLTSYTHIAYANSADGSLDFSVSDSNRKYIGMYVDFNATDSTNPSSYQWSLIKGADGQDGADGLPGKPGADGRTPYFHTAYANSADGQLGFSTTDSNGKLYMGTCTDYIKLDPTDYRVYTWVKIKGEQGEKGPAGQDGKGVKSYAITYQAGTSGTTPPTGTWSSTIPTVPKGQYLWSKTTLTYTDNTTSDTYSVAYFPVNGETGNGISSYTAEFYLSTSKTTQSGGSWTTTPPTWSSGKYLWTRYKIGYTNGSTAYTTPHCSSEWEAVNEIIVGGRNLVKKTGEKFVMGYGITNTTWEDGRAILRYGSGNNPMLKTEILPQNGAFDEFVLKRGVEYTQSIIVETDATFVPNGAFNFTWFRMTSPQGHNYKKGNIKKTGNEQYLVWCTASVNEDNFQLRAFDLQDLYQVLSFNISGSYIAFSKPKLEEGNVPTAWSPAPEDTQDQIDQANENISNKVDQGAYDQDKSVIYDDINKKLDDEEFREFQKTMNDLKSSYDSFVGEGGRYEQELKNASEREQAIIQNFEDKVKQLNFINTYIRESEEGIVIGAKNSPMQMLLSKDSLSFMDGGQTVAYFSNQSFYINRGAVVESLQVGVHKLTKVGNEHTVIQYIPK